MDVAALADLLHETSERHGAFEAVAPPHDWWDWYAAYMDARQGGSAPDEASAAADRYMAEVKHVVVLAMSATDAERLPTTAGVPTRGRGPGRISASTVAAAATAG